MLASPADRELSAAGQPESATPLSAASKGSGSVFTRLPRSSSYTVPVIAYGLRYDVPVTRSTRVLAVLRTVAELALPPSKCLPVGDVEAALFYEDTPLQPDAVLGSLPPSAALHFHTSLDTLVVRERAGSFVRVTDVVEATHSGVALQRYPSAPARLPSPSMLLLPGASAAGSRVATATDDAAHSRFLQSVFPLSQPHSYVQHPSAFSTSAFAPSGAAFCVPASAPASPSLPLSAPPRSPMARLPSAGDLSMRYTTALTGNPWGLELRGPTYRVPVESAHDATGRDGRPVDLSAAVSAPTPPPSSAPSRTPLSAIPTNAAPAHRSSSKRPTIAEQLKRGVKRMKLSNPFIDASLAGTIDRHAESVAKSHGAAPVTDGSAARTSQAPSTTAATPCGGETSSHATPLAAAPETASVDDVTVEEEQTAVLRVGRHDEDSAAELSAPRELRMARASTIAEVRTALNAGSTSALFVDGVLVEDELVTVGELIARAGPAAVISVGPRPSAARLRRSATPTALATLRASQELYHQRQQQQQQQPPTSLSAGSPCLERSLSFGVPPPLPMPSSPREQRSEPAEQTEDDGVPPQTAGCADAAVDAVAAPVPADVHTSVSVNGLLYSVNEARAAVPMVDEDTPEPAEAVPELTTAAVEAAPTATEQSTPSRRPRRLHSAERRAARAEKTNALRAGGTRTRTDSCAPSAAVAPTEPAAPARPLALSASEVVEGSGSRDSSRRAPSSATDDKPSRRVASPLNLLRKLRRRSTPSPPVVADSASANPQATTKQTEMVPTALNERCTIAMDNSSLHGTDYGISALQSFVGAGSCGDTAAAGAADEASSTQLPAQLSRHTDSAGHPELTPVAAQAQRKTSDESASAEGTRTPSQDSATDDDGEGERGPVAVPRRESILVERGPTRTASPGSPPASRPASILSNTSVLTATRHAGFGTRDRSSSGSATSPSVSGRPRSVSIDSPGSSLMLRDRHSSTATPNKYRPMKGPRGGSDDAGEQDTSVTATATATASPERADDGDRGKIRVTIRDPRDAETFHFNVPVEPECPVGIIREWLREIVAGVTTSSDDGAGASSRPSAPAEDYLDDSKYGVFCGELQLVDDGSVSFEEATGHKNDIIFSLRRLSE